MPAPRLDLMLVLRQALDTFWKDFGPIVLVGLLLLTLPSVIGRVLLFSSGESAGPGVATLVTTITGVLTMVFLCVVSFGVMARLRGQPLDAAAFMRGGFLRTQPGLLVALLLGALVMTLSIVRVLAQGAGAGSIASILSFALIFWGASMWLPSIPAAIAERMSPVDALRRGAALTAGQRGRLLGLIAIVGLSLLPIGMIMVLVLFGAEPEPVDVVRVVRGWTLASPGLWIALLVNLLVSGVVATIPPVVYHQLAPGPRAA